MNILCAGDQHITNRRPKNRTDDYYRTVLHKFEQELQIAVEEQCSAVLLPGDVFDSYKETHHVVQSIIYLIKEYNKLVFVVAGQHDQQFHNPDLAGTPLQTLIASGVVTLLTSKPIILPGNKVALYGASWNEEVPEIITPDCVNILVTHRMVIDDKLWAEQEGHEWANHLLLKYNFDLIVSGDNHKQFFADYKGKQLVNMGSMLRSTIAQLNHTPAVSVYDTEKKEVDIIDLEYKPFDQIMKIAEAEAEKERNSKLDSFIQNLKKNSEDKDGHALKLDFVSALKNHIRVNGVDKEIEDILLDCLDKE